MLAPVFPALPTGDVPASLLHMALRVGPAVVDVASLLVKSSSGNGTGTGTGTADKRTTILATLTGAWNVPLPNARLSVDVRGTMEHVDDIIALLDAGIQRVLVDRLSSDTARALYERGVPADRVMARRVDNWTDVDMAVDEERIVGTIVSATSSAGSDFARLPSTTIFECTADSAMSLSELSTLTSSIATADILLPVARVSISGDTESSAAEKTKLDLISTWISMLKTDRQDGLYPTVVVDERDTALGLVYSSRASLCEAVRTGDGVYYSRSRGGLWRKGETSGARQVLHRFEVDCDGDALKAVVTQVAPGRFVTRGACV